MAKSDQSGWRELCVAAVNEPDAEKLVKLVDQIIKALDAHREGLVSARKFAPCGPTLRRERPPAVAYERKATKRLPSLWQ
jgi:hypothetical protein